MSLKDSNLDKRDTSTPLSDLDKKYLLSNILKMFCEKKLDEESVSQIKKGFKTIYRDGFRHSYSELTGYLIQIMRENKSTEVSKLDILGNNLDLYSDDILSEYSENIECRRGVAKFIDHISLERIRFTQNQEIVDDLNPKVDKLVKKTDIATSKIENIERQKFDFIAILAIFSGIILAFSGGISFSNSILQGIADISIYRLVAIACICGMILVDTIYIFLYYICKIIFTNNKELYISDRLIYVVNGCFLTILISVTLFYFKVPSILFQWLATI